MATKSNPFEFLQQVRSETEKVTWPTRREVGITTLMVFIVGLLAALFFLVTDQVIRFGLTILLAIGS